MEGDIWLYIASTGFVCFVVGYLMGLAVGGAE